LKNGREQILSCVCSRFLPPQKIRDFSHEEDIAYLFTNDSHKYFELDSGARMPDSGIASRTSTAAVIAKHSFVARSVAELQIF